MNVKDGKTGGWALFGSPRAVRPSQPWPKYKVYQTKNGNPDLVLINSGVSINPNGEMAWQTLSNCLDLNELRSGSSEKLNSKTGTETGDRTSFYTDGGADCPGQCLKYEMKFDKFNIRFTLDIPNCGVNVDVNSFPVRSRNRLACFPCP